MLNDLLDYQKRLTKLLSNPPKNTNWPEELNWFTLKLNQLQHERHLHLLVTLTVGIASLISILATLLKPVPFLFIFDLFITPLFIAYLIHYRKLENTAQHWYSLLDKLKQKLA